VTGYKQININYQVIQNFPPLFEAFHMEDFVVYTSDREPGFY
jgi:hypothetical protein